MKTHSFLTGPRALASRRARFTPIRALTPDSLTRILDGFHEGELRSAALLWEAIEQRDDVIKAVATKRKKAPARFGWEIVTDREGEAARRQQAALEAFYRNLVVTHACDRNERGGFSLLLRQMMDAVGKRYAVHEIVWQPQAGRLSATFQFVPLWFFENRTGALRFLDSETATAGRPLEPGGWLVSTGDGLMEACSIAYLFKHLPLRDWLIYCERNGMPGVRGVTDALPSTPEWEAAREAVRDFGAEFHALMSRGTEIEPIDLSANGQLPYPLLVERMDKALATLWRGSSMGTVATEGAGISLQGRETALIEREDTVHLSGILNQQVDRLVLGHLFPEEPPLARLVIRHRDGGLTPEEVEGVRNLLTEALPVAVSTLLRQFLRPERFKALNGSAKEPTA